VAAANLASEEMMDVVDDKEHINKNQGGRCCLGKSSREGGKKKRKFAVDKRKKTTGGGGQKNVQEEEKERPYEGKEDIEHVLEIPTCFQGDSLTWSSWGPVAEKLHRRRRWRLRL
jgi:hypothetical protein